MPRNPKVEFDELQMYFGDPYVIDVEDAVGTVTVYSPTIGDIIKTGENKFYQTLNIFICNTTQYRCLLWDLGIDWNEFSDFQLFTMLYKQIDPDVSKLLFGELDFQKFVPLIKQRPKKKQDDSGNDDKQDENIASDGNIVSNDSEDAVDEIEMEEELILWDDEDEIEINQNVHNHFSQYLRTVFGIFPEEKITNNATLKQWYITKDKRAIENAKKTKDDKKHSSSMRAVISALVNHPGFKYKLHELKEVGVAEFYDSVKRLQIYEQSTALMKGMYGGFISAKDIKPDDYNFMREI